MKTFIKITVALVIIFAVYSIGIISGYSYGTAVSSVAVRSAVVGENAIVQALCLQALDEKSDTGFSKTYFRDMLDRSLVSNVEQYYEYQDKPVYKYDKLRKFSSFDSIMSPDLKPVARYIENSKSYQDIRNTPALSKLLSDYES